MIKTSPSASARLSRTKLPSLPRAIRRPRFDPARLGIGIVHLGCGAFHRGHQAIYTQEAIDEAGGDWGIASVSLKTSEVVDRVAAQDGLYTALMRDGARSDACIIATLREPLFAPRDPGAVIARIAASNTKIVTITATEKAYCHDPASGTLIETHPDIVRDIASLDRAASMPGILVAGLRARRASGPGPLTVVSCDNLPNNGATTAKIIGRLGEMIEPALARWIDDQVGFPSTMVDRIVPATTSSDVAEIRTMLGVDDDAAVVFEPYRQWVIENDFRAARPLWEAGGATIVLDVAPHEEMKLRLLNASHSLIAYLGYLAGHEHVCDAIVAPGFARLAEKLWDEAVPTLRVGDGADMPAYRAALLRRFANPAIKHRTWQIAMDGSQKLPQRLLAPIRANLAAGRPIATAALAVAAWMRYARGVDEKGRAIDIRDPLAAQFVAMREGTPSERARKLLGIGAIFGDDLPRDSRFVAAVTAALEAIETRGAASVARDS
jgi:fructuronate reductase